MKIGPTPRPNVVREKVQITKQVIQDQKKIEDQKDTVEISNSGREKLKNLADSYQKKSNEVDKSNDVSTSKLARIKNKIDAGYYDRDDVQSKIIEKLADTITNDIKNNKTME